MQLSIPIDRSSLRSRRNKSSNAWIAIDSNDGKITTVALGVKEPLQHDLKRSRWVLLIFCSPKSRRLVPGRFLDVGRLCFCFCWKLAKIPVRAKHHLHPVATNAAMENYCSYWSNSSQPREKPHSLASEELAVSETSQVLTDLHLENQELLVHSLNPECAWQTVWDPYSLLVFSLILYTTRALFPQQGLFFSCISWSARILQSWLYHLLKLGLIVDGIHLHAARQDALSSTTTSKLPENRDSAGLPSRQCVRQESGRWGRFEIYTICPHLVLLTADDLMNLFLWARVREVTQN